MNDLFRRIKARRSIERLLDVPPSLDWRTLRDLNDRQGYRERAFRAALYRLIREHRSNDRSALDTRQRPTLLELMSRSGALR